MLQRIAALAVVAALLLTPATPIAAQGTNRCLPGQVPRFTAGFAELKAYIGAAMGTATTCEYPDPNGTGDVHQRTTTGLAFWRKATNTPTFTNGFEHWGHTPSGWVTWTGASIDPPAAAAPPPPAAVPSPRNAVRPTPDNPVCVSAEIDGPAMVCWFYDGTFTAVRRTPSADVTLAYKLPGGSWVISRAASGAACGRVDAPPPDMLWIECIALDVEFSYGR